MSGHSQTNLPTAIECLGTHQGPTFMAGFAQNWGMLSKLQFLLRKLWENTGIWGALSIFGQLQIPLQLHMAYILQPSTPKMCRQSFIVAAPCRAVSSILRLSWSKSFAHVVCHAFMTFMTTFHILDFPWFSLPSVFDFDILLSFFDILQQLRTFLDLMSWYNLWGSFYLCKHWVSRVLAQ